MKDYMTSDFYNEKCYNYITNVLLINLQKFKRENKMRPATAFICVIVMIVGMFFGNSYLTKRYNDEIYRINEQYNSEVSKNDQQYDLQTFQIEQKYNRSSSIINRQFDLDAKKDFDGAMRKKQLDSGEAINVSSFERDQASSERDKLNDEARLKRNKLSWEAWRRRIFVF